MDIRTHRPNTLQVNDVQRSHLAMCNLRLTQKRFKTFLAVLTGTGASCPLPLRTFRRRSGIGVIMEMFSCF